MDSNIVQECSEAVELAGNLGFYVGCIFGAFIGHLLIELLRCFVLPFLTAWLHAERVKRGLPCPCEECLIKRYTGND